MSRSIVRGSALAGIALALTLVLTPEGAGAQMRRSAGPDGGPPGPAPRGIPRIGRLPYAGVWEGLFRIPSPTGDERPMPVVMVFDVADTATSTYSGATILPNGARAPHLETTVARGQMQWKQSNSGGGFWYYTGHFVTQDSVVGTAELRDWPQLPPGRKPPAGTFAVTRRAPGV
ncbi:MAG TPA: hypothetical protein VM076_22515 [Gemmatimonadaceae bacterium]|nr:hypothetical protein [Gemmatimonadaceae bacterium]